jgi:hypothetical protein
MNIENIENKYIEIQKIAEEIIQNLDTQAKPEIYIFSDNEESFKMFVNGIEEEFLQQDYISNENYKNSTNENKDRIFDANCNDKINYSLFFKNKGDVINKGYEKNIDNLMSESKKSAEIQKNIELVNAFFKAEYPYFSNHTELKTLLETFKAANTDESTKNNCIKSFAAYKCIEDNLGCFGKQIVGMANPITLNSNFRFNDGTIDIHRKSFNHNLNLFSTKSLIRLTIPMQCTNLQWSQDINVSIKVLLYTCDGRNLVYVAHRTEYNACSLYGDDNIYTSEERITLKENQKQQKVDRGLLLILSAKQRYTTPINTQINPNYSYVIENDTITLYEEINGNTQKVNFLITNVQNMPKREHFKEICNKIFGPNHKHCAAYIDAIQNSNILEILKIIALNSPNFKGISDPVIHTELLQSLKWTCSIDLENTILDTVDMWLSKLNEHCEYDEINTFLQHPKNKVTIQILNNVISKINANKTFNKHRHSMLRDYTPDIKEKGLDKQTQFELQIQNIVDQQRFTNFFPPFFANSGLILQTGGAMQFPMYLATKHKMSTEPVLYEKYKQDFDKLTKICASMGLTVLDETIKKYSDKLEKIRVAEQEAIQSFEILTKYIKLITTNKVSKIKNITESEMKSLIDAYNKKFLNVHEYRLKIEAYLHGAKQVINMSSQTPITIN